MLNNDLNIDLENKFNEMVQFVQDLGIIVHTNTKARGHQGFYLKNRIDISTSLDYKRKIEVLIHEFTHYIHSLIDESVYTKHGELSTLFPEANIKKIENELYDVTRFIDNNKMYNILTTARETLLNDIKKIDKDIKVNFPDFKRSYPYTKFEKSIKKTDARYLLKYDRVQVKGIFFNDKIYSIQTIDTDFQQLDKSARDYIKLKSKQRRLNRISSKINKLEKYYKRPSELFARFVEGLFINTNKVTEIAPYTYLVFCKELSNNRYLALGDFINKFF